MPKKIDRNIQSQGLIHSLLVEVTNSLPPRDFQKLHLLRVRARMLIGRIFGEGSHYMEDLRHITFPDTNDALDQMLTVDEPWNSAQTQFKELCNIMLEDLRLTEVHEFEESHRLQEPQAAEGITTRLKTLQAKLDDLAAKINRAAHKEDPASIAERLMNWADDSPETDYLYVDIAEPDKSHFHDLLKGFEDYAKLRGYNVAISIDASMPNKFGFKFTLGGATIRTPTPREVRTDLNDYIRRVERDDVLEDLPLVLPERQHQDLFAAMKNRINFLHLTIKMQKNQLEWREWNEDFLKRMNEQLILNQHKLPAPPITVNVSQDNKSTLSQSVVIGSPEERREQIEAIESLKALLIQKPESAFIVKPLEAVQQELKDEKPDPKRIQTLLETAKHGLKSLSLAKEVYDAAKVTWAAFRILSDAKMFE